MVTSAHRICLPTLSRIFGDARQLALYLDAAKGVAAGEIADDALRVARHWTSMGCTIFAGKCGKAALADTPSPTIPLNRMRRQPTEL